MILAGTPFAAIDFESAGASKGSTDVPVQIGIATMRGARGGLEGKFTTYLASEQPIIWSAQKVHGIRTSDLTGAPRLLELWPRISPLLQHRWIVAHGAATERRFLRAFPFHGFGPWVDTLKLSRAVWPDLPSHALRGVIRALDLEPEMASLHPEFRWHDALSDAIASLVLLRKIVISTGISEQEPETLLQADDSHYHRGKKFR